MAQGGDFFLLSRTLQIVREKVAKPQQQRKTAAERLQHQGMRTVNPPLSPQAYLLPPPPQGLFISNTFEG